MSAEKFSLDNILITFPADSTGKQTYWTNRNAVEGVQIFGGIGSGKTSGSGRTLALKYLAAGFGGLVLTVKPQERQEWEKYCEIAGRLDDLVIISPDKENYFNFLEYESTAHKGAQATENLLQVLKTVIRSSEEKQGGKSEDPFWETAVDMLIANTIDLCQLAFNKVTVALLYELVLTIPNPYINSSEEDTRKTFEEAFSRVEDEIQKSTKNELYKLPEEVQELIHYSPNRERMIEDRVPEYRIFNLVKHFFHRSYVKLPQKTRSIIDFSFTGFLFGLMRDPVYSLFCVHPTTASVRPEQCYENGKIILIDLPVKLHHKAGRDCQILYKYVWQRAMERRGETKDADRPVFLWADEAQNFIHEHDADFQATARSSKVATVYISQNLPNYFGSMGGNKAEYKVKSFLGTLATKIFHANADIETNRYASDLIGEEERANYTASLGTDKDAASTSVSQVRKKIVPPEQFGLLKTGGKPNAGVVEGYMHIQGAKTNTGGNHICANFRQDYEPKSLKTELI